VKGSLVETGDSDWENGIVADCVYRMGQPFPLDIGMLRQITQKKTTTDN
jgi:hypothetical protein